MPISSIKIVRWCLTITNYLERLQECKTENNNKGINSHITRRINKNIREIIQQLDTVLLNKRDLLFGKKKK